MKTYAILVALMLLGLGMSWLASAFDSTDHKGIWLMQLASALVIGGGVAIIEKVMFFKDHMHKLSSLLRIRDWIGNTHLESVLLDANQYSYTDLIVDDPILQMALNDGRTWISSRISDFQRRFTREGFITEFFVTDPDKSAVEVLAEKTGYSREEQVAKIEQAKKAIDRGMGKGRQERQACHLPRPLILNLFGLCWEQARSLFTLRHFERETHHSTV